MEHGNICHIPNERFGYFGWPSIARMDDGTLIAGERLYNSIHSVFGSAAQKDYYAHLSEEFFERLRTKEPIVKTMPRPEGDLTPPKK